MVILYGVKWLLENDVFPFERYEVDTAMKTRTGSTCCAAGNGKTLVGEAFNVAPSFFSQEVLDDQEGGKSSADYKIIMFNHDAVRSHYEPEADQ